MFFDSGYKMAISVQNSILKVSFSFKQIQEEVIFPSD